MTEEELLERILDNSIFLKAVYEYNTHKEGVRVPMYEGKNMEAWEEYSKEMEEKYKIKDTGPFKYRRG